MAQQTAQPVQQKEAVKQPVKESAQPAEQTPVEEKKSKWWLWVIIAAVVIIGAGVGIFFWLF